VILNRFDTAVAAASALADQTASALRLGLARRGSGSLAVAGGRTPVPLFRALRTAQLEWDRVGVTLTDERWVAEDHVASNAALVRRELLADNASRARFHPLFNGSASADAAVDAVWESLHSLARPFDAVVLGMGEDGHFASLFPDNPGLDAALDEMAAPACVGMRAPVEPHERISLNLAALLEARRLFLFITGAAKRELLLAAAHAGELPTCPVAVLLAPRQPITEVYWAP
jgi:6-phosphogluconolactonase